MRGSLMADAFGHHVWATRQLLDACTVLRPEQLATAVPGTFGTIMETQRHTVGSDAWYLFCITGDRAFRIDEDHMDLSELRAAMQANGDGWSALLAQDPDPDAAREEVDEDDGYRKDAPIGVRLAQALHHGTDHRSQVCTALTSFGVEPPNIDVWSFGLQNGRVTEVYPPTTDRGTT